MVRWFVWSLFVLAWTVALEIPSPSGEQLPMGQIIVSNRIIVAKTVHVLVYTAFAMLTGWLRIDPRYRWLMMFFLMLHAWGSEMLQELLYPICFRGGSLTDVGLDLVGIVLGVGLTWKWWTGGPSGVSTSGEAGETG